MGKKELPDDHGGLFALRRSQAEILAPQTAFADPATKAIFLQANYDWNLRTATSLTRAVQEYGLTITRDPRVALGYVGLANSYLLLREYGSVSDAAAYPRAEAAAQAAVGLSPDCAEARRALAFIDFWWKQDRFAARREFNHALALKPDDPLTHHWLANALLANGEREAALTEINTARDLDQVETSIIADRATILYFAGHHTEGLALMRYLTREQPQDMGPHRKLAEIALYENRPIEFLREFTIAARLRSDADDLNKTKGWQSAASSARMIEEAMLRDAIHHRSGWFQIAKLEALMGRREEAEIALSRSCKAREPAAISAPVDLWLSRSLNTAEIAKQCGRVVSLS